MGKISASTAAILESVQYTGKDSDDAELASLTVRPYSVYTALLTQTGGDAQTSGLLIEGGEYTIDNYMG
jgi:hypothetical protein